MKLAIMQPYLFPYLGYFQLIGAVDAFVVYDDVAYKKGGWINRNCIISNYGRQLLTMPVSGGSQNRLINQVQVHESPVKLLKTLQLNYARAPRYSTVFPLISEILHFPERNLALYLQNQLKLICSYLDLEPKWILSSELCKSQSLRGQEKIIAICEELRANHYINLPGGVELYDRYKFSEKGVELSFLQPRKIVYPQFRNAFESNLSIIDVLMFNDKYECARLLKEYDLV